MFNPLFMEEAIKEAQKGLASSGIPIGSVLVHQNKIIGRGHNQRIQKKSVTLHAEMDALEQAGRLPAHIYQACTLYTTLSPCSMCSGAILLYQIPRVIIGENKNFMGDEALLISRGVTLQVLQDKICIDLMTNFIHQHPTLWQEDIGI
jgi:creatinine deaminase|tara:strand:+ start:110016 stop:110459 length:444 start_codon:yes stop_codon:yes gene_type:complete